MGTVTPAPRFAFAAFAAFAADGAPSPGPEAVVSGGESDALADVLAVVLSGRPERITDLALATEAPEVRAAVASAAEAVAAAALAEEPIAPGAGLRARLMKTLARRASAGAGARKAVLVVDMICDHLEPGRPLEVPRARDIVPALAERLEEARRAGVPVLYVVDEHDPDDADLDGVDGWGAHAVKGTGGTDVWPPLAPRAGDRVVHKATYSAFHGSELAAVLDEMEIDTLVLTGCLTELGVLATATDALQRGFAVEVPADAQAGSSAMTEQVALGLLSIMPPYGPARRARLDRFSRSARTAG